MSYDREIQAQLANGYRINQHIIENQYKSLKDNFNEQEDHIENEEEVIRHSKIFGYTMNMSSTDYMEKRIQKLENKMNGSTSSKAELKYEIKRKRMSIIHNLSQNKIYEMMKNSQANKKKDIAHNTKLFFQKKLVKKGETTKGTII